MPVVRLEAQARETASEGHEGVPDRRVTEVVPATDPLHEGSGGVGPTLRARTAPELHGNRTGND